MLNFDAFMIMLIGFAQEPIEPDRSDSRYLPIRQVRIDGDFRFQYYGHPRNYSVWISPASSPLNNLGYMGLQILSSHGRLDQLVFRVCSASANRTYEYAFNFIEGAPRVKMRQGSRASIRGENVLWEEVRCIDFVVFDLIEHMLPPQITAYRPEPLPYNRSTAKRPCFVCGNATSLHAGTCDDCRNGVPFAASE